MNEHENAAEEETGGVGQILTGAARGGTVNGFEHGAAVADVGGACETDRAGDLSRDVRKNIAIEVGHDDNVEGFRSVGHFGCADIDDPEFFFELGVFGADFIEDLVEEAVGELHDVVFGEAGDFFAVVLAGVFEGVADNFFGAGARDEFEALVDFVGLTVLDARVEIFLVFADDDDVHARMFGLDVGVVRNAGADVGVEAKRFAGGDVERFEAAALGGGNRCLVKDFGAAERFPRAGLDARVDAAEVNFFADFDGLFLNSRAGGFHDVERGGHDFGADAVAVRDGDGDKIRCHVCTCY